MCVNVAEVHDVSKVSDNVIQDDSSLCDSQLVTNVDQPVADVDNCDTDQLMTEQKNDLSLTKCWELAQREKGDYIISRGLLYHKDKV